MATPNIVPRADTEGGLGTAAKSWGKLFIENASDGGTAAATISNLDIDKIALDINASNTTANVLDVTANTVSTADVVSIQSNGLTTGSLLALEGRTETADTENATMYKLLSNFLGVGTSDFKGQFLDINKVAVTASGKTANIYGSHIDLDDNQTNVGTVNAYGMKIDTHFSNTGGTVTAYGIDLDVDGADTNIGIQINTAGTHMKLVANADVDDYATLAVADTGDLTIATVGDGTTDSDLVLDVDGDIEINADGGDITFKDDSTTLAAINSAGALTSTNYRTIYVDAGSMLPTVTNGAAAGTEELATNDVMVDYFAFDTSTDEKVQFKMVMPEQWDNGTIKAKFYWKTSNTDTGNVAWFIQAVAHADSAVLDTAFGTAVTATADAGSGTDNDLHITAASAAMTVDGSPAEGEMVLFQIYRDVSADNYNADAHLLGVNLQYKETTTASAAW